MYSFFITGTDTDVGKTIVTTVLTYAFRKKNITVFPYKPIQSGGIKLSDQLFAPDVLMYQQVLPFRSHSDHYTYLFEDAVSPHLAARMVSTYICKDIILDSYKQLLEDHSMVLVEGAGGLAVPLNDYGYLISDLIKDMAIPVILVARAGVGTINHTVLSIEYAKNKGIQVAGIIINGISKEPSLAELDNLTMIEKLTNVPILGKLPFIENIESKLKSETTLKELSAQIDLDQLPIQGKGDITYAK